MIYFTTDSSAGRMERWKIACWADLALWKAAMGNTKEGGSIIVFNNVPYNHSLLPDTLLRYLLQSVLDKVEHLQLLTR
jgi:hypothetical protein